MTPFAFYCFLSFALAWSSETPPNLDEKRVKIMPGFPRDGDLPKPIAKVLPPFVVTLPILLAFLKDRSKSMQTYQYMGFVLIASSHILMRWVQRHCGRFYTFDRSIKTQHKLITSGPYRYCQNPGYVSLVGTALGVALFTNFSWINLLPAFIAATVLSGIPTEERMLREEFEESYAEFQRSRARFIPFVF